jgi:hypothetical protein
MTENAADFAQSLHKIKGPKFAEETDEPVGFIEDLHCSGRQN